MGKKDVVAVETVEEVLAETGVEVAEAETVVESEPTIADVVAAVAVPAEGVALEGNLGVVAVWLLPASPLSVPTSLQSYGNV